MRISCALLARAVAACDGQSSGGPDAPGGGGGDGALIDGSVDAAGSGGCGTAGAATGQTTETIMVGGVARTYLRVVPATYDPMRTYPLIFAWHGRTGSATVNDHCTGTANGTPSSARTAVGESCAVYWVEYASGADGVNVAVRLGPS